MQSSKYFSTNLGFSLIEIIVAMGVMSVVSLGVVSLLMDIDSGQKRMQLAITRDRLSRELSFSISNLKSFSNSITMEPTANQDLSICLNGDLSAAAGSPELCQALTSDAANGSLPVKSGFILYPPLSKRPISGKLGMPLTYTSDGVQCEVGESLLNCPINVETWYVADCIGANNCLKAADLQFFYKISIDSKTKGSFKSATNELIPTVYSSLLANDKDKENVEPLVNTFQSSSVECGASGWCCLTVGFETRCMELQDVGGISAVNLSGVFGKWGSLACAATAKDIQNCGDLSQPCNVGLKCRISMRSEDFSTQAEYDACRKKIATCVASGP